MKKLTQLINLFHTSGFIFPSNQDGKSIDKNDPELFRIIPSKPLAGAVLSLGGQIDIHSFNTQILLPFTYDGGNVDHAIVNQLPPDLVFYIECIRPEHLRYTGLPFGRTLLFVSPGGNSRNYTFYGKTITCKPCSQTDIIGQADLVPWIQPDITLDEISRLIGAPVGSNQHVIDLKASIDGTECIIKRDKELHRFHQLLYDNIFKEVALSFKRDSDNSDIKSFPKIRVLRERLNHRVIGIIQIPLSSLSLNHADHGSFSLVNNFIVHFPAIKPTIELEISTKVFDAGSKLSVDETEVAAPVVQDHPDMPGYKKVKGSINNYEMYLRKSKKVIIQSGDKKTVIPIDPVTSFDSQSNKSTIIITK